jgi:Bacterial Ig-like domain
MTTTPVVFWGRGAAPPFNGPLTISETTPGDVNTASFFDASNNPVNQGISLGDVVKIGYAEIGESTSLSTDYFFLDGKFLGNTSDSTAGQVITDLKNAYTNDIVNGGNNTAQLAIDDAAIEAGRLGVPVSTIEEPFFDSAGHLVQAPTPFMSDVVKNSNKGLTTLSGMSLADSTVSVFDGSKFLGTVTADGSGDWSLQANISRGTHQFTETATDLAGNTGASTADTVYAPTRHQTLTGGNGNDFLIGGPNDTLIGAAGNNTFVFNQGFGKETVADFNPNQDELAFNHALFTQSTAAFVLSHTHDTSAGAVIVVDHHDTVTLVGVTVAQLQAALTTNWIHFF